jgi:hypothetical protein
MHGEKYWTLIYFKRGTVSRNAPWISHLLFADDCLIFTQATKRGADRVAAILEDYNKGSGQLVNKQSRQFFSAQIANKSAKQMFILVFKFRMRPWERSISAYLLRPGEVLMLLLIMCLLGCMASSEGGQKRA